MNFGKDLKIQRWCQWQAGHADQNPLPIPTWLERPWLSVQAWCPWRELVPEARICAWIEHATA